MERRQPTSPDKIIVDRRRKKSPASDMVRSVRLEVAGKTARPIEYEIERLHSYAESHVSARIALPLFLLVIAFGLAQWTSYTLALFWVATTLLSYGLLYVRSLLFLKTNDDEIDLKHWRFQFVTSQILIAASWSLFAFYDCSTCGYDSTFVIVKFSIMLVFQAITMMLSYGIGSALLLTSAPPTIIFALLLLLTYQPANAIMGAILITSQVFFYFVAEQYRTSLMAKLKYHAEREELIAELATAKSISEEARRRAEEANLAKSRFLATMSHELRTPLNAILGFSEVMKSEVLGPLGNDTYKSYVKDIHDSGTHLLNVINEILDLSRIEAGRHELNEEAISLANVVDDARHMVELRAKTKGVSINMQAESNLPPIWADEKAVRQITLNLLSNALKFTPTNGRILIRVGWTSRGGQYLSIQDNGPGIPEEEIPVVLSSFGQGSIAIKSAEQGSGLGLPIVQALMHMHNGKFELKSKLREGTVVIATFPRSRVLDISGKADARRSKPTAGQKMAS